MTWIERKILTCATELNPGPREQERIRSLMSQDVDVDHLINEAYKEGLAGLLYRNLLKSGLLDGVGVQQRERLESLYYQTVRCNLKLIHDVKEILSVFNQRKIRVVLLQGIALLHQVYEDIGLRPLTDIDLWVLEEDYPGLIRILSDQEYQRDPIYPNTFRKDSTIFDINTHLLWADRIRSRTWILTKSQKEIYNETRVVLIEGREAHCLNQYDQVLYLSLHVLKHCVSRLIWLVDIKSLLLDFKKSDWETLVDRARELGQEKTMSYVFFLLRELFEFQIPSEVHQHIKGKRLYFLEKKILRQRITKNALPVWAPLIFLSSGKGLLNRFRFVLENVFPRPEILRQVFAGSPHPTDWQLYWKRVLQVFGMIKIL